MLATLLDPSCSSQQILEPEVARCIDPATRDMQRDRRLQQQLNPHVQRHQKLMIFALKAAYQRNFLPLDIRPLHGMRN